jgi:hypothetical protein
VCEHWSVNRTTVFVLIALGAAIAGFAFSSNARRADDESPVRMRSVAAGEQTAVLGWRETTGEPGEQLVFSVDTLRVLEDGWRVDLALENRTGTSYRVLSTQLQPFGLMVLATGSFEEFEQLARDGALPAVRPAVRYEPQLPDVLEPGDSWRGTISAPGALVATSYVRVVFGGLVSVVTPRESMAWITDHAHQLRA